MPIKHTNFASSKLAVGIGASDVTLSVTGTQGARFPVLGAGDYCYLVIENATKQREIVKATARSSDTFTVVRGQDDTTAQAWIAGDTVSLRFVKAAIADSLGNGVQRTSATGSAVLPTGTTAQRDGTPLAGYIRYNTTTSSFEGYSGSVWASLGSSTITTLDPGVTINGSVVGYRDVPQNSQSAPYTFALSDAGKHILHPSADTVARIFTIPANSSVAFPIGTAITIVNQSAAGTITIAITSDIMRLAGQGTTGSRTLAANGICTILKITATEWIISGSGLT